MMKKVLITGGAGFIGTEIVNQLYVNGGWDITVLDSMTEQIHGKEWRDSYLFKRIENKCKFVHGSVTDTKTVIDVVMGTEYIIHLAAETGTGQSMYQINQYNDINVMGTSNILQAISSLGKTSKVKKSFFHLLDQFMVKVDMSVLSVELYTLIIEQKREC